MPSTLGKCLFPFLLFVALLLSCSKEKTVLAKYDFVAGNSSSVFEQTTRNFRVAYDSSEFGVFVKAINDVSQTKTAYWLYFVNGNPGKTAADKFIPQVGDTIEWRLLSGY